MKQLVCMVCALGLVVSVFAQISTVEIATNKTTALIFPYPIKHVDRGSKDVLVQPVKESQNILLVKAAIKGFDTTNLSVVTEDGSIYSFAVFYGEPGVWIYRFPVQVKTAIATYAAGILDNPKTMKGIQSKKWEVIGQVSGIYIKDDVMYLQLDLQNQSPINYDINFLRFFIKDKSVPKRTAIQENELEPLYTIGNDRRINAGTHNLIVVALNKLTLPEAKYLAIEIGEKDGGRNLSMKISNRKIMKAIALPDLR